MAHVIDLAAERSARARAGSPEADFLGELVSWSRDCTEELEALAALPGTAADKRPRALAIVLQFMTFAANKVGRPPKPRT